MNESSNEHAEADRRLFTLSAEGVERLEAILDRPPVFKPRLSALFASKAPWDE